MGAGPETSLSGRYLTAEKLSASRFGVNRERDLIKHDRPHANHNGNVTAANPFYTTSLFKTASVLLARPGLV